ncbi:MAG: hypothetical protein QM778_19405 [Myxococcales bacterium]
MASPTVELVAALRTTAQRLMQGANYKWSHFGQCNCGHLAQTVTQLSAKELQDAAFARAGDWGEQALEYCPTSGYPVDYVLSRLFELGLEPEDMKHLERLTDDRILRRLGVASLLHTRRDHVVSYMLAWAAWLEERLAPEDAQQSALAPELALAAE